MDLSMLRLKVTHVSKTHPWSLSFYVKTISNCFLREIERTNVSNDKHAYARLD